MTSEWRQNGRVEMHLKPSDEIEKAFIRKILEQCRKGQVPKVEQGEEDGMILSVEK